MQRNKYSRSVCGGYLFHLGCCFVRLIRVISAVLLCRRHSAYRRAYPALVMLCLLHTRSAWLCMKRLCLASEVGMESTTPQNSGYAAAVFSTVAAHNSALILSSIDSLTAVRSQQSNIAGTYNLPFLALTSVMSVTHLLKGLSALKSRFSRSSGFRASIRLTVSGILPRFSSGLCFLYFHLNLITFLSWRGKMPESII